MTHEMTGTHLCWRCDAECDNSHRYCEECGAHQSGWEQTDRMRAFEDRLATKIAAKMPAQAPSPWPNPSASQNLTALLGGIVFVYAVFFLLTTLH